MGLEIVIGRAVVAWLERDGWEVFQEVAHDEGVADVVARRQAPGHPPEITIVECKRALGFAVLAQGERWRHHAHRVWCAVERTRQAWNLRRTVEQVFGSLGVGLVTVDARGNVHTVVQPTWNPSPARAAQLAGDLRAEHKTYAPAGTAHGGHFTAYKGTCAKLREYVATCEGVALREAVRAIDHHYANEKSAHGTLKLRLSLGQVAGVELREEVIGGRKFSRLYLRRDT